MLYTMKPEIHVREMKGLAGILQPFTPPKYPADDDISWFKQREVIVDGYSMIVHYSEGDYGEMRLDILTIGCKHAPFIPFNVVCKVAKMFLGDQYLTLFEYTRGGRKIYSWMLINRDGKPINDFQMTNSEKQTYNGFDFYRGNTSGDKALMPNLSDSDTE